MNKRLGDLARRYDAVAEAYARIWGPALASMTEPLITALGSLAGLRVLDVACGAGPLPRALAAAGARTICLDVSQVAVATQPGARIAASMTAIPLHDRSADLSINTFSLQHTPTAGVVLREMGRVTRGAVAVATWGVEHGENGMAYAIVQEGLDAAGAPTPETPKGWHDRVDTPDKMERLARRSGLGVRRAWSEQASYQWRVEDLLDWFSVGGHFGRRFQAMEPAARTTLIASLREELWELRPAGLQWKPDVVFLIAEPAP